MKLDFKKLDSTTIAYKQDKYDVIKKYNRKNKTKYKYFKEIIYDLFEDKGKELKEIARIFDMTIYGISYHLKKMGCKMKPPGGARHVKGVTGIPGVYPLKTEGRYTVWHYHKYKKNYVCTCNSLFSAVVERRAEEIRNGFTGRSLAQEFINKNWLNIADFPKVEQPKIGRPYYADQNHESRKSKVDSSFHEHNKYNY